MKTLPSSYKVHRKSITFLNSKKLSETLRSLEHFPMKCSFVEERKIFSIHDIPSSYYSLAIHKQKVIRMNDKL